MKNVEHDLQAYYHLCYCQAVPDLPEFAKKCN